MSSAASAGLRRGERMAQARQIVRQRRPEFEKFACGWMFNAEDMGMQRLSSKSLDCLSGVFCQFSALVRYPGP